MDSTKFCLSMMVKDKEKLDANFKMYLDHVTCYLLRAPVCENQTKSKFRGKGGKFDFFHILILVSLAITKIAGYFFGKISFCFKEKCK